MGLEVGRDVSHHGDPHTCSHINYYLKEAESRILFITELSSPMQQVCSKSIYTHCKNILCCMVLGSVKAMCA